MRIRGFRYALTISAAAVLAGCGALPLSSSKGQDDMQPGIGAPGAMPQTAARGTVRHIRTALSSYQLLFSFNDSDGAEPYAGLVNVNGTLYGTTYAAGARNLGTVFSITTAGTEKVLYSFFSHPFDGFQPKAGLIDVNGTLYGTTLYGGTGNANGTVFKITTNGREKILHSFGKVPDGAEPAASLIDVNGTLYGTTANGGASDNGTVFSITTAGSERVLHSFAGGASDGANPQAGLIEVSGTLYGTTVGGGAYNSSGGGDGTVFSISTTGAEHVLHSFGGSGDGLNPAAGLIDAKGTLYGTTRNGGASGNGTVFSISTAGAERVLYSFGARPDGAHPAASLIDVNGTLYGTTANGGAYGRAGHGTVFRVSTAGTEYVVHSFEGRPQGSSPTANLIDVNGKLYGTTAGGGKYGWGTVFALK